MKDWFQASLTYVREIVRLPVLGLVLAGLLASPQAAHAAEDAPFISAANEAVDRIAREDGFSGVILMARGDEVLLRKAAGLADREKGIAITPETKFSLQSVTKQFTAAGVMLLVQDGKLSVDDLASKYYPGIPPIWRDITIKHLLTHSSGIADFDSDDDLRFRTYEDAVTIAVGLPALFSPGARYEYNNAGYALLAAVIERVSGQRYGDFLRNRIFAPLGMRNTGYGAIPGDVIRGYMRSIAGEWQRGRSIDFDVLGGEGGIYSTLDDMLIWSNALARDQILAPSSRNKMWTDYGYNYGFGWRFATKHGQRLIWHTGNFTEAGFAAIFDYFPDEALTVILMTNNTGLTNSTATLVIGGRETTFPANSARKVVEYVENLYFTGMP